MQQLSRMSLILAGLALFTYGCAGINPDARKMLQEPSACESPQQDIRLLEDSRAGGFKRVSQGIQGVAPPSVVISLIRDIFIRKPYRSIYLDHWRVAFGSYNKKIDARVAKLEKCDQ